MDGPWYLVPNDLRDGEAILRRAEPFDAAFHAVVPEILEERGSLDDDEAFRDLGGRDVVVVPFPFPFPSRERPGSKRGPALVLSRASFNGAGSTVLAKITTRAHRAWPGDVEIEGLEQAGLPLPCIVRTKLFTLHNDY